MEFGAHGPVNGLAFGDLARTASLLVGRTILGGTRYLYVEMKDANASGTYFVAFQFKKDRNSECCLEICRELHSTRLERGGERVLHYGRADLAISG